MKGAIAVVLMILALGITIVKAKMDINSPFCRDMLGNATALKHEIETNLEKSGGSFLSTPQFNHLEENMKRYMGFYQEQCDSKKNI
jgi:hypothetical protein